MTISLWRQKKWSYYGVDGARMRRSVRDSDALAAACAAGAEALRGLLR